MKRLGAGLLAIVILFSLCKDAWMYLSFTMNQEYISENLCINISKPQLMCNGACFLTEKLATSKEKEQTSSLPVPDNSPSFSSFLVAPLVVLSFNFIGIKSTISTALNMGYCSDFITLLFRPPKG